jgi:hypothetical protein
LWTPIRCNIIPSTKSRRCRHELITPTLMPDDRLQTPIRRLLSEEKHRFGANWRTFILIAADAPTPKTKNSKTLHGSNPWFPHPPAALAAREGRGTSGDDGSWG